MNAETHHVVLPIEAECYIESLKTFEIKNIGKPKWLAQHEIIEKLNIQAILSASTRHDEYVKDFLVMMEKIPVLIHEMIAVDVWKQKVLPEIFKLKANLKSSVPIYLVLHHEASLANLLETIFYHHESSISCDDYLLDVIDYCYRKITYLLHNKDIFTTDDKIVAAADLTQISTKEEIWKLQQQLEFGICFKAISILCYIIEFMFELPVSVSSRILLTHDVPMLLVALIEESPWIKYKDDKMLAFIDNNWKIIENDDKFQMTKTEGQIWIAFLKLFTLPEYLHKYEINNYRKNKLLKLRPHLNDIKVDQLPNLIELMRFLHQLDISKPMPAKKDLIFEQVPQLREKILKENKGLWQKIAIKQASTVFDPTDIKEHAQKWADIYNFDTLEELLPETPKCAACGNCAKKRCSQCRNERYCSRACQVKHWSKHKNICQLVSVPGAAKNDHQ